MILALILAAGLAGIAALLGWFTPMRSWEEATGWQNIPRDLRPPEITPALPGEPRIDWLGHSGFVLTWDDVVIVLDPNTRKRCTVARRSMELPVPVSSLPAPDAILISHAHYDHMDIPTITAFRRPGEIFIPKGSEVFLPPALRDDDIARPVEAGQSIRVGPLEIIPINVAHNGNRMHPLQSRFEALGYIIRREGFTMLYAGDTGFTLPWTDLRDLYHPDLAILPIGSYRPSWPLEKYHLNPEQAAMAAKLLGVRKMIPCHFGTFALSFDRPASALPRFAQAAKDQAIHWGMPRLANSRGVEYPPESLANQEFLRGGVGSPVPGDLTERVGR